MIDVRELDPGDVDAALRQNQLAFLGGAEREVSFRAEAKQGFFLGAYDGRRLVGVAELKPYRQWFAGRDLPMTGLASVSVAPHARGRGIGRLLLNGALARMHDDGTAVSVLYPSNPGVYQALGWECAGVLASAELPTAALGGVRPVTALRASDEPVVLRPAEAGDVPAVHALYTAVARRAVGPLTRTGPIFDPQRVLDLDGVLLAERAGAPVGYVSYERRPDPGLFVYDLVGADSAVYAALLRAVGSWQTVVQTVRIRAFDPAVLTALVPVPVRLQWRDAWMLRLVNAETAVAGRGWPVGVTAAVDLELVDEHAPWQAGRWRMEVAEGRGRLARGGTGAVRMHVRGFSALFTGYTSTHALRAASLLEGHLDAAAPLDAVFAGPTPWMADAF